jgi:hypothetical protein
MSIEKKQLILIHFLHKITQAPFGYTDKLAEKHCWLICCERKILFRLKNKLKNTDYKSDEQGLNFFIKAYSKDPFSAAKSIFIEIQNLRKLYCLPLDNFGNHTLWGLATVLGMKKNNHMVLHCTYATVKTTPQ